MPEYISTSVRLYFGYLERLQQLSLAMDVPFARMDRVLYQLDFEAGNKLIRNKRRQET